jgi:uncharacterized membrane protein YoaK (UPF0700 family)
MSQFRVYVTPEALAEIKDLTGNVRQRIREAIRELAQQPHPPRSNNYNSVIPIASYFAFGWITGELFMPFLKAKKQLMCWPFVNVHPMTMVIWSNYSKN